MNSQKVPVLQEAPASAAPAVIPEWRRLLKRLVRNRQIMVGILLLCFFVLLALGAPWITPYAFDATDMGNAWAHPSTEHPMGTDRLGRDVASRLMYGTRISLSVGLGSTMVAVLLGVLIGAVAGYAGGWVDLVLMRVVEIMQAFPSLLFMILLSVVLGSGLPSMILAIGITRWAPLARIVRSEFLRLRDKDFVLAARATGASNVRIVLRHILPNALSPIVVYATFGVPFAIMSEAGLGFIGLGMSPPTPSWGLLLNEGFRTFRSFPNMLLYPSLAISFTMFGFIMFGNGLRDVLDPKIRS